MFQGQTKIDGFLLRLKLNQSGNVLAIVAAAMIPVIAMIGGGVDISRYYITKSRLQNACDAAAMAGRKSMTGTTWASADETLARNFFNTNFPNGTLGSKNSSITFNVNTAGVVTGTAVATSPSTIMALFNVGDKVLSATCKAELQLPNSDVMFVLDTTLSMNETNPGDTQTRIAAMRAAVQNFYTNLEAAKAAGTQVRYGFVPYSSTVNVGLLLKREWMVDQWTYQSRVADIKETVPGNPQSPTITNSNNPPWVPAATVTPSTVVSESCNAPANIGYSSSNGSWSAWSPDATSLPRTRTRTETRNGTTFSASRNNSTGVCTITRYDYNNSSRTVTQTVSANPNAGQTSGDTYRYWFNYQPVTYDVSSLKGSLSSGLMAGGSFVVANFNAGSNNAAGTFQPQTINWGTTANNGCIEERATLRPDETVGTAYDLDIDLVPIAGNSATQWRPSLPRLVYARSVTNYYPTAPATISGWSYTYPVRTTTNYITPSSYPSDFASCPTQARKLAEITSANLTTYLNSLTASGRTYHDVGMLWGLRLLSAQGIFGSENISAPNGGSIARHVIFMTDGATETNIADYDAYGLAALDRRRTAAPSTTIPTDSGQNTIVESRLGQICTAGKAKGITVWVIAFGTSLTDLLRDCATSRNNHAFQANNTTELESAFSIIAGEIAQLRLTQ